MLLKEKLEHLREEINKLVLKKDYIDYDELISVSRALDEYIIEYIKKHQSS